MRACSHAVLPPGYVVGIIGKGKYAFGSRVGDGVVAGAPKPFVLAAPPPIVPVQVAPLGQHAIFRLASVVQSEPCVQHDPP